MTGSAIFPLVKGIHGEIFTFLGIEGFHLKQTAVAGAAGKILLRMVLMRKNDGLYRFGIKNAGSNHVGRHRGYGRETDQKQIKDHQKTFMHWTIPATLSYKIYWVWRPCVL